MKHNLHADARLITWSRAHDIMENARGRAHREITGWVEVHPACVQDIYVPGVLTVSSAEFPRCAVCGHYEARDVRMARVLVEARVFRADRCDCDEIAPGRILHDNGGNYHIAAISVLDVLTVEMPPEEVHEEYDGGEPDLPPLKFVPAIQAGKIVGLEPAE